jgi:hypothetical protein
MSQPAQRPAATLTSLPPALSARILQQLPVADRVRAGGVSPAWRAVAHAPELYGPELVLRAALDAPRTVQDAAPQARGAPVADKSLRCSAVFVLRALASLARGTLTALDATHSEFATPDAVWSEALVAICAANPGLARVTASTPKSLPGALQLLRRCPRMRVLTLPRLATAVTAETLAALTPEERALSTRLALNELDLGRKMCPGPQVNEYSRPEPAYLGALTSAEARASLTALRAGAAAVGAGAWAVRELHLPGCKADDSVLVDVLAALTAAADEQAAQQGGGADQPGACRLQTLVLHYSFKESACTPMSAAAARALAAALEALPSLRTLRFQDKRDPEIDALEKMYEEADDGGLDAPALSSYLFEGASEEALAAYDTLEATLTRRGGTLLVMDVRSRYDY